MPVPVSPLHIRVLRSLFPLALTACVLVLPGVASAAPVTFTTPAITDNYKTWTDDPTVFETTTWFRASGARLAGVDYAPACSDQHFTDTTSVTLNGADDHFATATFTATTSNVAVINVRVDATCEWGPVIVVGDRTLMPDHPISLNMNVVRDDGVALGSSTLDYVYDLGLAALPAGNVEYHSLGGRWYLDGAITRADWEAAPPVQPDPVPVVPHQADGANGEPDGTPAGTLLPDSLAPQIRALSVRTHANSRAVTVHISATDNVKVTMVRIADDNHNYGPWRHFAATMHHRLTRGRGRKLIRFQVCDAAGNLSAPRVIDIEHSH